MNVMKALPEVQIIDDKHGTSVPLFKNNSVRANHAHVH